MVDRRARDAAAASLQQLADGVITNFDYEERYPRNDSDPALREIWRQVWFCYSDLKSHTLTGKHIPSDEYRSFMQRCILFLESDFEFEWPRQRIRPWYAIGRLIGLRQVLDRRDDEELRRRGDVEVWPFLSRAQYERAQGEPRPT